MLLCSSLTYNAKEIRMLLKEGEDEDTGKKYTTEWIIIDPASFTGNSPNDVTYTKNNTGLLPCKIYFQIPASSSSLNAERKTKTNVIRI